MSDYVQTSVRNHIGFITLDRPKALNSLSLAMVRAITATLLAWREDAGVSAVFIHSSSEKAFCAGGDIRFFYDVGTAGPTGDSALLEDFFTEEYALNHLIHFYPKPYVALMNGVVMGGGMGIAQAGEGCRLRIVTERTKMAMPEVNIGLFPDVGGGYFLSRTPGQTGTYLGLTGEIITAADALYTGLADVYIPTAELPALMEMMTTEPGKDLRARIRDFAAAFASQVTADKSTLAQYRAIIDRHFAGNDAKAIAASLVSDPHPFAQQAAAVMQKRSPLLMSVTLEQLRRGISLSVADCLRMERTMVRHCFQHGEVLEGVRALVVAKDNAPQWQPANLAEVTTEMVQAFFAEVWPGYAHPLRYLD
ncbi:enoyl-CoA hydratase/isomerase family protein [Undibacterium sp. Jales W-56]|uniref:enoyl-CoA hydratase/isomerase family protein n=1 Tax=Undibacterium sp. Jales W-56 TaxID=2897325 RepID=UPI0021D3C65E|nr:enoyl-CoA hydratase/isomerase family protein [Undibacterium sp. Jales W-56]MCU6432211.1 enoyl-CoA hydratase/isomerase family protein [Undibacterium sp. Jales W-56]